MKRYHLLIACPDKPGLIAAVSGLLFRHGGNITAFDQHSEGPESGMFFMRAAFEAPDALDDGALRHELAHLAATHAMDWRLMPADARRRLAVFVSREPHCLQELLGQCEAGDIRADIVVIISNHPDLAPLAARHGIPYYHVPVTPETKPEAEAAAQRIVADYGADTLVLARYMQILSPQFVERFPARIINIHHSFLPAFVGPRPYHQAYARGVKLIGATAHYVTAELDAGPIIEQDVERVDHRHQVRDFRRIGRYVERIVLARAVAWHVDDRVLVHGNRTIVFPW
jgi:formyltetrahydrofolate deformylase